MHNTVSYSSIGREEHIEERYNDAKTRMVHIRNSLEKIWCRRQENLPDKGGDVFLYRLMLIFLSHEADTMVQNEINVEHALGTRPFYPGVSDDLSPRPPSSCLSERYRPHNHP